MDAIMAMLNLDNIDWNDVEKFLDEKAKRLGYMKYSVSASLDEYEEWKKNKAPFCQAGTAHP